ncbi:ABC transporter ATP-binding protein [Sediminispirochaeta bajacaliforniensis]|uniref:ABC transporter ATP-binding protein n=1 Tax=Sediminispirochaeta bajacaliforniensis TaxID=148 RepID=UPI00036C4237|nr:ABC transporter ATP-binding protein [Sediminispirochaeta bajacaliforniensis]
MSSIRLTDVSKSFGNETVIDKLNLNIKDHSFTVLVGPSGCGKSTTLRMITGLETPTAGDVFIDDVRVNDISPGKRDIAMVFQNYALYPTMTVEQNISFGLENKKISKEERKRRIQTICDIVGLAEYLKRKPSSLSGGQRQRVALARAMVKDPQVFLMDEPLSNLDAKLRTQMRVELISLHKKLGTTFVYVTHDQVEAMSMADDIVLMDNGKIVQQSIPSELYNNPNCVYAAQFVGSPQTNVLSGYLPEGVKLGFRPEKVQLNKIAMSKGITMTAKVVTKEVLGSEIIYSLSTRYGSIMAKTDIEVADNTVLNVGVDFVHMYLFDKNSMRMEFSSDMQAAVKNTFTAKAGSLI